MPSLLDGALALAAQGFRVLPLGDAGGPAAKKPRLNDWVRAATADEDQIRAWWAGAPAANVGVAMGNGLVAIDIDGDKGGIVSWRNLTDDRAGWSTLTSHSGSGKGFHLLYRLQPHHDHLKVRNRVGVRDGIDVRADGGQIVAPPSIHPSGGEYRWADPAAWPEPLPDWLFDVIVSEPARELSDRPPPREHPPLSRARGEVTPSSLPRPRPCEATTYPAMRPARPSNRSTRDACHLGPPPSSSTSWRRWSAKVSHGVGSSRPRRWPRCSRRPRPSERWRRWR